MEKNSLARVPRNARLIFGRMTGWGQEGPLRARCRHDINYIAITGASHHWAAPGAVPGSPPLNLLVRR